MICRAIACTRGTSPSDRFKNLHRCSSWKMTEELLPIRVLYSGETRNQQIPHLTLSSHQGFLDEKVQPNVSYWAK